MDILGSILFGVLILVTLGVIIFFVTWLGEVTGYSSPGAPMIDSLLGGTLALLTFGAVIAFLWLIGDMGRAAVGAIL